MKFFNEIQTCDLINEKIPFYEDYKLFLDLIADEEDIDSCQYNYEIKKIGSLFDICEKKYDYDERLKLVQDHIDTIEVQKKLTNNSNSFYVFHEYKQFPLIPKEFNIDKKLNKLIQNVISNRNSYGVLLETKDDLDFLEEISVCPFLLYYRDLNVIPLEGNTFFTINHHCDIFEVTYQLKL